MANYLSTTEAKAADYMDYVRVTPAQPISVLGATFEFFYTVHAIPTIGVNVSLIHKGQLHQIQISGDTLHHAGLHKFMKEEVISSARGQQMLQLIPTQRHPASLFFADVGEAHIHGHPSDWQRNPNDIIYYHCPDMPYNRSFGHPVTAAGQHHILIQEPRITTLTSARLLRALRFLDITDPSWLHAILQQGRHSTHHAGEMLQERATKTTDLRILVAGTAVVSEADASLTTQLGPGDFFGCTATADLECLPMIQTITPVDLFTINAPLIRQYLSQHDLLNSFDQAQAMQSLFARAEFLRHVDQAARHQLAQAATCVSFAAGEIINVVAKTPMPIFFLAEGRVEVSDAQGEITTAIAETAHNYVGERAIMDPDAPSTYGAKALTRVRAVRLSAKDAHAILAPYVSVRHALGETSIGDRKPPKL